MTATLTTTAERIRAAGFTVREIGPCVCVLGDCLQVLPLLEAGSVHFVLTDPPYGIDYQSARRTDKSQWKPKIANDESPFVWFLPGAFRATTGEGCLFLFCRWDVQEPFRLAASWAGWRIKSQVVWDRIAHGMGDLNGSPAPQHDMAWFAVKGKYQFFADRPRSVVRSMRLSGEQLLHPNEKPVDLMTALASTEGCDSGVVLLSYDGTTHTEVIDGEPMQVYDHEYFSPLGDALMELYHLTTKGETR